MINFMLRQIRRNSETIKLSYTIPLCHEGINFIIWTYYSKLSHNVFSLGGLDLSFEPVRLNFSFLRVNFGTCSHCSIRDPPIIFDFYLNFIYFWIRIFITYIGIGNRLKSCYIQMFKRFLKIFFYNNYKNIKNINIL